MVTRHTDNRLALGRLGSLVEQLHALVRSGRQVILVTSGAVCVGRQVGAPSSSRGMRLGAKPGRVIRAPAPAPCDGGSCGWKGTVWPPRRLNEQAKASGQGCSEGRLSQIALVPDTSHMTRFPLKLGKSEAVLLCCDCSAEGIACDLGGRGYICQEAA